MKRSCLTVAGVLLVCLTWCHAATNTVPDASTLLKQLAANPYDKALLANFAKTAVAVSNAEDRARYVTVYCLGALATGDNDGAAKGKAYLVKTFPSSPYLKTLSFDSLGDTCSGCQGSGKVEGACSACKGSGKCVTCRGTGSVKRSGYSGGRFVENTENCTACRGSGDCKQCKGTRKETKTCVRCAGGGKVWSVARIKEEYLAMLSVPVVPGPQTHGNLDFSDVTGKALPAASGGSVPSLANQVRTVEVEGTAATADEALKDAFSSAVKSCIGVMVNAEQVVESEEVIKDEILTYSNGYIKDYDDLGSAKKGGLIVRRIRATVILGRLASKLREKNITVNEIKGESLFSEAVTVNQERSDFKAMLRKVLEDYDLKKLWTPRLVERRVVSQTEQDASVEFVISLVPDKVAISAFHQALQKVLATKYRMQRVQVGFRDVSWCRPRSLEGLFSGGETTLGTEKKEGSGFYANRSGILFVVRAGSRLATPEDKKHKENADLEKAYTDISCLYYDVPLEDWRQYFWQNVVFSDGECNALGGSYNIHVSNLDLALRVPYVVGVLKDAAGRELDYVECAVDYAALGRAGLGQANGPAGFDWKDVGFCSVLMLHGEGYPPGQYVRLSEMDKYQKPKPLIVAKTFKIDELREIKNIELTIELREVGKDGQTVVRVGSGAIPRSSPVAKARSPETLAVGLAKDTMKVGTETLDQRIAIGSDTATGQVATPAETARDGQKKTIALLPDENKASVEQKPEESKAPPQQRAEEELSTWDVIKGCCGLAVIIWLCVVIHGWVTRCPSCGKRRARVLKGSELLNQYQGSRTKKVYDHVRNRQGKTILTTEHEVVIPTIESEYLDGYKCKFCGHEWQVRRKQSKDA